MKTPYASFGKADYRLKQGIGSFIIEDNTIAKYPSTVIRVMLMALFSGSI